MKSTIESKSNNIEILNDPTMPPEEILRPGEIIEAVNENNILEALKKVKDEGAPKKFTDFINKWTVRGLLFLTLAYFSSKEAKSIFEEKSDKNKIENLAGNIDDMRDAGMVSSEDYDENINNEAIPENAAIPEIIVYGHSDEVTDKIINCLSSKEPLSEDMCHELEARVFLKKIRLAYENYQASSPEKREEKFSVNLRSYLENIKPRLDSLDETDLVKYRQSKDFERDLLAWEFASIPKFVFDHHPIEANDDQTKFNYFRIFYASCGPGSFEEMWEDVKNMPEEEIRRRIMRRLYSFSNLSKRVDFSAKKYDAVWTLQQEHGNPRVDFSRDFSSRMLNGNRAYYSSYENKMYLGNFLEKRLLLENWLAELSHAEQYKNKYSPEEIKQKKINDRTFLELMSALESQEISRNINVDENWGELYDKYLYDKEGSIEYEAHKEIQPKLTEELEELSNRP